MSHIHHCSLVRRMAGGLAGLAGLACVLLAGVATSPAAWAVRLPADGASGPQSPAAPVPTIVAGGMPGWQIVLIAAAAALAAAALAVLLDRARAARRRTPASA